MAQLGVRVYRLANLDGSPTIEVLSEILKDELSVNGTGPLPDTLDRLVSAIGRAFNRRPADTRGHRLLVHGAGFAVDATSGAVAPAAMFVGNDFEVAGDEVRSKRPDATFSATLTVLQGPVTTAGDPPVAVTSIGASLTSHEHDMVRACVKRWAARGHHPMELARLMGAVMNRVAARYEQGSWPVIGEGQSMVVAHSDGSFDFMQRRPGQTDEPRFGFVGPLGVVMQDRWSLNDAAGVTVRWLRAAESTASLIRLTEGVYLTEALDVTRRRDPFEAPRANAVFTLFGVIFLPRPWPASRSSPYAFHHQALTIEIHCEEEEGRLRFSLLAQGRVLHQAVTPPLTFREIPGGGFVVVVRGTVFQSISLNGEEVFPLVDTSTTIDMPGFRAFHGAISVATDEPDASTVCAVWIEQRSQWLGAARRVSAAELEAELDELYGAAAHVADLLHRSASGPLRLTNDIAASIWTLAVRSTKAAPSPGSNPLLIRLAARLDLALPMYLVGAGGDDSGPPIAFELAFQPSGFSQSRELEVQVLTDLEAVMAMPVLRTHTEPPHVLTISDVLTRLASTKSAPMLPGGDPSRDVTEMSPAAVHSLVVEIGENVTALSAHVLRAHGRTV